MQLDGGNPGRPSVIEAEAFTMDTVLKHWTAIVQHTTPPSVRMSLKNATVAKVEGVVITLSFPSAFHRDKVSDIAASRTIEDILHDIFKSQIRLECRLEEATTGLAQSGPETSLVEAAEEVFGM